MFSKLTAVLAVAIPYVAAFTITTPSGLTSQGNATINWTTSSGDPPIFTIELTNPSFNSALGIANNVPSSDGTISLTLPVVPADASYTIEFVNVSNITDVFASTGNFAIGAVTSSSTSSTSSSSGTSSRTSSGITTTLPAPSSTASFGTTLSSPSVTSPVGASTSGSSTTASAPSTSNLNGARASVGTNAASYVLMVLGAVAGAGFVGF